MTLPVFSVIVPTYDRLPRLRECLQALARLDYPRRHFEVVVVDDGGNTPPKDVVALFWSELDVTVVTQPHAGPATARNTGAVNARGRFLVFTDDDCRPAPSWLHALEARFAETPDSLVGGRVINALLDNRYATASQVLIDYLYSYYNADFEAATFFASNNMAVPAADFAALGGFDSSFPLPPAEDREFCDRWLRSRRRMRYTPGAVVYHAHALGFRTFWRQHFKYGRGAARFHSVRARYTHLADRLRCSASKGALTAAL